VKNCDIWHLSLAHLSQHDDLQLNKFAWKKQNFIHVCGEWYCIGYINHISFIHPSFVEHIGWFHSLNKVNGAAVTKNMQGSLAWVLYILLCIYQGWYEQDHEE
jgi:hypothetical protein